MVRSAPHQKQQSQQSTLSLGPNVPAPPAKSGTTLRGAEELRKYAWEMRPFVKACVSGASDYDWDPVTRSFPARTDGTCRHKATWLQRMIGDSVLYGRRTDEVNPGYHAVLWVNIGGHDFVIDRDGVWPAKSAPFACDARHKAYRR